ncbi:hypothetical protein F4820DRAFT_218229 [Hypoxylon rubiginosum]|uniref:Uncharacterized protein n=1 Tax=Hypoxylon rubiginosum TaxID=110542 RepID=A0ACB9ZI20_9PEZI|nr:hypothetical protein F4820DRAFT_218229 [Hypoxylon rubiginosum]
MQFGTITTLFALAAVAIAAPSEVVARTDSPSCTNNQQEQVCCTSVLGVLSCLVQILGQTCTSQTYCCDTTAPTGTLVNIQALNCIKIQ